MFDLSKISLLLTLLLLAACGSGNSPSASYEVAAKGLYSGAISPGGSNFAIGSIHHGGSLWDQRGERIYNWNHSNGEFSELIAMAFSPEGDWLVSADARSLVLWSTRTGKSSAYLATAAEVLDIALGSNGNYALVAQSNNTAVLYSLRQKRVVRILPHNNRVRSVAISNDGRLGLTGSEGNTAILWDLNSGRPLHIIEHDDIVGQVALSPDGRVALSAAQYDKAVIWYTQTGQIAGQLPLNAERLKRGLRFTAARFDHSGNLLLTGTPDQTVQLWDVDRLEPIERWQLPKRSPWKPTGAAVTAVEFGHDGNFFALAANGFAHQLRRAK